MAGTTAPELTASRRIDKSTQLPVRRPQRHETPETALQRIRLAPARKASRQAPSGYVTETGEVLFRQGASIGPHVLTVVETTAPASHRDRIRVTTRRSPKMPWREVTPRTVEVPKHWVFDVFTSNTVPSLVARSMKAIIPVDAVGDLLKETEINEEGWLLLNDLYTAYAPAGRNTPLTLLQRIDYHGELAAQLPLRPRTTRTLVLYPRSGDIMRAARTRSGEAVADGTLCWYQARTTKEAAYLTVLLNTSSLQHAYTSARESGRHFHLHPWRKVPIPRYDDAIPLHREIAELCAPAEKVAARIVAAKLEVAPGKGHQPSLSKAVRGALANDGIGAAMDECARQLLPDQAE